MKKTTLLLLAASMGSTIAAPAIVWKNTPSSTGPSHMSNAISTRSLLTSVKSNENEQDESALSAVIFLVGRTTDGTEGLSALASSGKLPSVQEKHRGAAEVHHHVQGVESSRTIAKDVTKSKLGNNVAEVSMKEFTRKLSSIAQVEVEADTKINKVEQKRRRAISEADVLVVTIGAHEDPTKIDAAIVAAIDSSSVRNVILSTIRSTKEVKHARKLATMEKRSSPKMTSADGGAASAQSNANGGSSYNGNGRRLEDEDNENNQNQNANADEEGVYYVNMTPNILAGLLFFFMFVMTAHLGLTCMNAIEGQDVYVKKLPAIGREV